MPPSRVTPHLTVGVSWRRSLRAIPHADVSSLGEAFAQNHGQAQHRDIFKVSHPPCPSSKRVTLLIKFPLITSSKGGKIPSGIDRCLQSPGIFSGYSVGFFLDFGGSQACQEQFHSQVLAGFGPGGRGHSGGTVTKTWSLLRRRNLDAERQEPWGSESPLKLGTPVSSVGRAVCSPYGLGRVPCLLGLVCEPGR